MSFKKVVNWCIRLENKHRFSKKCSWEKTLNLSCCKRIVACIAGEINNFNRV